MHNEDKLFKQVTKELCGTFDLTRGLAQAYRVLGENIPSEGIFIGKHIPERKSVHYLARAVASGGSSLSVELPIDDALHDYLLSPMRPVVAMFRPASDFTSLERACEPISGPGRQLMMLRMRMDETALGVAVLFANSSRGFSVDQAALMGQLHEPFAMASALALQKRSMLSGDWGSGDDLATVREAGIVGCDKGLRRVMEQVHRVAAHETTVLLLGETGVGKELVARAIHEMSGRRGPFLAVNCGAFSESLMESELFGHEKGAFTGATSAREGCFEAAEGGTLFLDEVGELSAGAQIRLLRVLQERTVTRVGGYKVRKVDARVVAATNRDLPRAVAEGTFREDLWYRLSSFPIAIPPLRERREDIPDLVRRRIAETSMGLGIGVPPAVSGADMARLMAHAWRGNVRELWNCVERAMIAWDGGELRFFLEEPAWRMEHCMYAQDEDSSEVLEDAVRSCIIRALAESQGKIHGPGGAAERLGVNPSTLRSRLKKLGIPFGRAARG
ncbi:sigma-54 interaction domain-containing protein [Desulfocurvus sp. DL9XJH121]